MKKVLLGSLVGATAVAAFAFGANSGISVGENVTPFHPNHISGPLANSTNCFPCTFQNRPQVQVWVNGDDLKTAGIPHVYEEFPGGHTWDYWLVPMADTLRFFKACLGNEARLMRKPNTAFTA